MSSIVSSRTLAVLLLAGSTLGAAEPAAFRWHLDVGPTYWTRTRLTYGANASVDPSTAAKTDRTYDDGFNKVDASGNLGDGTATGLASRTGNFGFISDSQVDLKAGTLALHRTSALDGIYRDAGNTAERPSWQVNLRLSLADVKGISEAEVQRVHKAALLIDTHNDVPWKVIDGFDVGSTTGEWHTDLARLKRGGVPRVAGRGRPSAGASRP